MLRLTRLLNSVLDGTKERETEGKIAIWNLTNRCNLSCLHCYSKASLDESESLSFEEIKRVADELKQNSVHFVIVSGGEPLARRDIFDIARELKERGIKTYLSTNGLYINEKNISEIVSLFDYIGVSIDGDEETHDYFRGLKGAYRASINAIKIALKETKDVGVRFTLTDKNIASLPHIFELSERLNIKKIYISHLVYAGRGGENSGMDITPYKRKKMSGYILDKLFYYRDKGIGIEITTGNMEQEAVLFLERFRERYPHLGDEMERRLKKWGGNSAGVKIINIDYLGNVKPDPFFPMALGNIHDASLEEILSPKNELAARLLAYPRALEGECAECAELEICNGGSRSRAYHIYGNLWAQDPSCYIKGVR